MDPSKANVFKLWTAKAGPQPKTVERSSPGACILNAELEDAELQGAQTRGGGDQAEAGRKQLQMASMQEAHAVYEGVLGKRTWSRG